MGCYLLFIICSSTQYLRDTSPCQNIKIHLTLTDITAIHFFFFYHNAPRWQSFKNIFIPFPIFLAGGTYLFSELLFPRALLCCAMYITETSPETTAICQNICLVLRRTQLQFYDLKVLVLFRLFSVICHFLTIFCFWPYLLFHLH